VPHGDFDQSATSLRTMNREQLLRWLEAYERSWRTPGTDGLSEIFSADASYSTAPYEKAHRGLEAIAAMWEAERRTGEEFTMESEILAAEGDTGVVRVRVDYRRPRRQEYRDLWVIRLDRDGRCIHFEEWPFWPPGTEGDTAAGA
jgi:SnoaL-like domain